MASHLLTKYITGSTRCRSFWAANLNYLWISRTWFLATKAKTMRPSPWKRAFFSFVFIISLLLTQGVIYRKRDSYVLRFSWLLRSGSQKKTTTTTTSLPHASLEWLNNALCGKEIAVGFVLRLFSNALGECLSVRSLESWNRCTCLSCTLLLFISYRSSVFSTMNVGELNHNWRCR